MFSTIDHLTGAVGVRLQRVALTLLGKPDLTFLDQNLAIGGHCNIKKLWKNNIQAILDLREENQDSPQELEKYSMQYLRLPISDSSTPTLENALNAIQWIKSRLDDNRKVFVHCNLGRGRAPLLACTYLISQGIDKENALRIVQKKRKYTYLNKKQLNWINEFHNTIFKS